VAARKRKLRSGTDPSTITDAELLDAALEVFADRGFDGASIRELARDLGLSHNLIPQRFGSKERLWFAAIDHGFGRLAGELMSVSQQPVADDLEMLRALVVRFVEANASRPSLLRIINLEACSPGPRLDYLFDKFIAPVGQFGAKVLARLRGKGQVRTDSVALVYFLMTHGAGGFLALPALAERFGDIFDPGDPDAVHRRAVEAVDVLFEGLVSRSPR
jgi:AcrR family transcriptional regulator